MHQVQHIADGKTKIFYFTFPFFLKSDVIVEINSQPATNYNLIPVKNGSGTDIPFAGGEIHFNTAPRAASLVTIKRKLPIKRIVDYQPTNPYNPMAHNQDMNYLVEIIKDMQDCVDFLMTKPMDSIGYAAIAIISRQITQIISTLGDISDQIPVPSDPVDLSEINSSISSLGDAISTLTTRTDSITTSISALATRCTQLETQIENIGGVSLPDDIDYVVESQLPTAANNYTWYRKYASGWVEQGGSIAHNTGTSGTIILNVPMATNTYTIVSNTENNAANNFFRIANKTTTGFNWYKSSNAMGGDWMAIGIFA